jgi:hypothetical protein
MTIFGENPLRINLRPSPEATRREQGRSKTDAGKVKDNFKRVDPKDLLK